MKRSVLKQTAAAAAAFLFVCGAVPVRPLGTLISQTVLAESVLDSYTYIDEEGNVASAECKPIAANFVELSGNTSEETWYVVDSDVTLEKLLTVKGRVSLILADGYTMNAKKAIYVHANATFRIFGQAEGTGTLNATEVPDGKTYQAGIGAKAGSKHGSIEIYGGTVNAVGGKDSAGIGGTCKRTNAASGAHILIAGGTVTAQGGDNAAGIGGGNVGVGGDIIITGGTVTATGGRNGAGIGGGQTGNGGNITISGGEIYAYAGAAEPSQNNGGAGIGSGKNNEPNGYQTSGGSINITGGTITAVGSAHSAGIGGGYGGGSGSISISDATITATGQDGCDSIGDGADPTVTGGSIGIVNSFVNGMYYDADGHCYIEVTVPEHVEITGEISKTVNEHTLFAKDSTVTLTAESGWTLENVTAECGGEPLALVQAEDGESWSFTVPGGAVSVSADSKRFFEDGIGDLGGITISLKGDISVNLYMELDESVIEDESAYMHFTLPNNDPQDVAVSSAQQRTQDGILYYVFPCKVAAKNMTDEITAQMIVGENSGETYTCSVKEYADYVLDHQDENAAYKKAVPLVTAMLNYGTFAQDYFGYNTEKPANEDRVTEEQLQAIAAVDAETVNCVYDPETENLPEGVVFEGSTLLLKSKTMLKLFFTNSTEDSLVLSLSEDSDASYTIEETDDYTCIVISNISAQALADPITVQVKMISAGAEPGSDPDAVVDTDPEQETETAYSVTYSPMHTCSQILSDQSGAFTDELKDLMRAFYLYHQAAFDYFRS